MEMFTGACGNDWSLGQSAFFYTDHELGMVLTFKTIEKYFLKEYLMTHENDRKFKFQYP